MQKIKIPIEFHNFSYCKFKRELYKTENKQEFISKARKFANAFIRVYPTYNVIEHYTREPGFMNTRAKPGFSKVYKTLQNIGVFLLKLPELEALAELTQKPIPEPDKTDLQTLINKCKTDPCKANIIKLKPFKTELKKIHSEYNKKSPNGPETFYYFLSHFLTKKKLKEETIQNYFLR